MEINYKKADISDLNILIATRLEVLRTISKLPEETDMSEVSEEIALYYRRCFENDEHVAFLAYQGKELAGCGGISFYTILPTYHNPSGKYAYIMNMYTRQNFRRKGIATKILDLLIAEAKKRNIKRIGLEATSAGKPLYEKYGFLYSNGEMYLPAR